MIFINWKPKIYIVYYKGDKGESLGVVSFKTLEDARNDIKYNSDLAAYGEIYKCNQDYTHKKFIEKVETINRFNPHSKN